MSDLPPRVLIPYDRREAISLRQAAEISGKSVETIRRWASLEDIGRRIGGQWAISHPALLMKLDGDRKALRAYLAGDRESRGVKHYFERMASCVANTTQAAAHGPWVAIESLSEDNDRVRRSGDYKGASN